MKASVQKVKRASQVKLFEVNKTINQVFERWGLPQSIKIDNGFPIVNPVHRNMPTLLKLWWIGLGIEVIQNSLGRPQENGVVECLQGICYRWSCPKIIDTPEELQNCLDEISDFQRNHYHIPKKGMKTRIQCYPELETNPRKYDPNNFNMKHIWNYLDDQVWKRRVSKNGSIHFSNKDIHINRKYAYMDVCVTFDPNSKCWIVRDTNGNFLKSSSKGVPNELDIKTFAIMSKN